MINRLTATSLGVAFLLSGIASADSTGIQFHSFDDGAVYTKPFTGLKGGWNEEFGFVAPFASVGPWTFKYNAAYIQTWPLSTNPGPQWTAGGAVVYQLCDSGLKPGIYTKAKNNLQGLWQQETGFTAKWTSGRCGLVGNAGYLFDYPRDPSAYPLWQVGLSFCYYLR